MTIGTLASLGGEHDLDVESALGSGHGIHRRAVGGGDSADDRQTQAVAVGVAQPLGAKALVLTAVVTAASALAVAGSLMAGRAILRGLSFDDSGVRRAALSSVLYLALIGLLALGVAAAVRNTAAAALLTGGLLLRLRDA